MTNSSLPPMATPEQLRANLHETLDQFVQPGTKYLKDIEAEILALIATFLASIELPEKHDLSGLKLEELQTLAGQYIKGSNAAIDQSQAIIDKLVEELK